MSLRETKREGGADDILAMATRALRDQCDGQDGRDGRRDGRASSAGVRANPAATRSRVMMSLRQQERRRTAAIYILLPAAAVLAASTAWAAANGRLPSVVKSIGERLGLVQAPEAPASNPTPPSPPTPMAASKSSAAAQEPALEAPAESVAPVVEAPAAPSAVPLPARSTAPRPLDERGDKLYEAAHRAHFEERNWPAALTGWERYLAASPRGRFVPEARYNRAIVLLRLDRRDEAVRELTPFAEGKYGGYRQEEARGLIEALQK